MEWDVNAMKLKGGINLTDEKSIYYKSRESSITDFYLIHVYSPEHFAITRYLDIVGSVTSHFSTIHDKYLLKDLMIKNIYKHRKLEMINQNEYDYLQSVHANHIKAITHH